MRLQHLVFVRLVHRGSRLARNHVRADAARQVDQRQIAEGFPRRAQLRSGRTVFVVSFGPDGVHDGGAAAMIAHDRPQGGSEGRHVVAHTVVPRLVAFAQARTDRGAAAFEVGRHLLMEFGDLAIQHMIATGCRVLVVGVDQHQTGDLAGKGIGVQLGHQAAIGMADEDDGGRKVRGACQRMKIIDGVGGCAGAGCRIAESSAVPVRCRRADAQLRSQRIRARAAGAMFPVPRRLQANSRSRGSQQRAEAEPRNASAFVVPEGWRWRRS